MTAVSSSSPPSKVQFIEIGPDNAGQRIDNFLLSQLKGVPKSRVYKMLRSGEVRINKGRAKPATRLNLNDIVRIPPVRMTERETTAIPETLITQLNDAILYETTDLVVINKPAGLAVHAGSDIKYGVIDIFRASRYKDQFIELAHRLDRQTSGCLILARSREALLRINQLMQSDTGVQKTYLALTRGTWPAGQNRVDIALSKNESRGGERIVVTSPDGKPATSLFTMSENFSDCSLVEVILLTGRTHQIRVHAAHEQHPIAGDEKYGDREFNKSMKKRGLKRMFLHARELQFDFDGPVSVTAPLDKNLQTLLNKLRADS